MQSFGTRKAPLLFAFSPLYPRFGRLSTPEQSGTSVPTAPDGAHGTDGAVRGYSSSASRVPAMIRSIASRTI